MLPRPTWRGPGRGASTASCSGVAQEKESAWRGWRDGGSDGHPYFEFARLSVFPNFYYFYINDSQFGPCFVKDCSYAPFSMWVWCLWRKPRKHHYAPAPIMWPMSAL